MASRKKPHCHGLRVNTQRKDSTSYLLSPELSSSPPQFSMSPPIYPDQIATNPGLKGFTISGRHNGLESHKAVQGSVSWDTGSVQRPNTYVSMNDSWQEASIGSQVPLLPSNQQQPCLRGVKDQGSNPLVQSNFMYGVGDLDRIHIEDGRPKTYDYADYGHQYEELPNRKSIAKCPGDSGIDSRSELYQSSGGTTDVGSEVGDMANIVNAQTEKRKRVNPLYDGMTQSMPSIYSKGKDVKDVGLRRQVRCLKCALIVLVVVSCASLAVGLYAVISNLPAKDEADPLTPRVNKLSEDYSKLEHLLELFDDSSNDTQQVLSNLMHQIRTLNANMTSKVIGLQSQLDTLAHDHALDLQDARDNLTQTITMLNLTLQMQLHNLSKQEGPRGPQGVANFTLCSYYNITEDAVPSDTFPTYTMWTPTEHTLETHIALYSACSVDGGTETLQEVNAITTKKVQYRCRCNGLISGKDRRRCTVHIMLCPRES